MRLPARLATPYRPMPTTFSGTFAPEPIAMRSDALGQHNFGAGVAKRGRPSGGVVAEERLQGARDEVRAGKQARQNASQAGNRRQARRRRSSRRHLDAEAPGRGPAPHPPRPRTPLCVRRASRLPNALAPIHARPRRRTSRVPRTAPTQSPVSIHAAAASHRRAGGHRRSSLTVRQPPRETCSTARPDDRPRRTRSPRPQPAGRTP